MAATEAANEETAPLQNGVCLRHTSSFAAAAASEDDNHHDNHDNDTHTTTITTTSPQYYYLTAEAAEAIHHYQYKGEDRSLMYKYLLSPLAQFLVDYCTPSWLAPNSITLLGLSLMVAAYSFSWYYVPTLEIGDASSVPRWIFGYNCVAMLIYQTLDNMDGKQARRTKSSSPLGLLFDHGCDAVNSIFGSANWIIAMALFPQQDSLYAWIVTVGPYAMFYIATWEEYYTGELILPLANGPNEGLFCGAMLNLVSCLYGPQFWRTTSIFDSILFFIFSNDDTALQESTAVGRIRNADIIVVLSCVGFLQETILKSYNVSRIYGYVALLDSLPFFLVSFATLIIGYCDSSIFLDMPRTSLHLYACLVVEMVTELMRAHITHQKFEPFQRWINLPLLILMVIVVGRTMMGISAKPEWMNDILLIYTTAACTYLCMKLTIVVDEICRALNIWCFDIVTPRRSNQQPSASALPNKKRD